MLSSSARSAVLAAGVVALAVPARAKEPAITGAWKLVSYAREEIGSGAVARPWGEKPQGYLLLLPSGHMSMVITSEGRTPVSHDDAQYEAKSAKLMSSVTAYAGTYTLKGDTVVFHVEAAWQPDWVGTDQPRQIKIDQDVMSLRTQPMRSSTTGKDSVYVLTWKRAR
jgi:hypothetical protein